MTDEMFVIKRDGAREPVSFDKVLERIRKAATGLSVNYTRLAQLVLAEIHDGVHTTDLDELAARLAISYMTVHPDWGTLAAQIIISNCQRSAPPSFNAAVTALCALQDRRGDPVQVLAPDVIAFIQANKETLDAMVHPENDFLLDYFGFKTLEKAYLLRGPGRRIVETPQYMWLRVAIGIHYQYPDALERIQETYELMSTKAFTHATPTLFNSGTKRPQMSSCFLQAMKGNDSLEGIFDTLKDCATISKYAGGIGLHIHDIRAQGTPIAGTQGTSNGIVPMLRVFNNTARYVDQCFAADTVIMVESGPKWIVDIVPGDKVMTSGGSEYTEEGVGKIFKGPINPIARPVTKLVEHTYTGTILHVTFDINGDHTTVKVTPQHPFLAYANQVKDAPDYYPIDSLKAGDYVCHPTALSRIVDIREEHVENMKLYDLEVEETHDYTVVGAGIAHNGGGKRNGSIAVYLEPWHADVQAFLKMKSNTGAEEERARDLFYALWIPDLFMKRVEAGADWSLFCPHEAPGLSDVVGVEFERLYTRYEAEGRAKRTVSAQKLWSEILVSQIETGTPYLLYKDAANAKSNQKHLGTIKSSNLCVAPGTLILTIDGWQPIISLRDQRVQVWNGNTWSWTTVHQTGVDQELMEIEVAMNSPSRGPHIQTLLCTPYHKFILPDGSRIEARDLENGMELTPWYSEYGEMTTQRVVGVIERATIDDTYCFNEPLNHAGVFNGILTGNCTEIIEYSSPEETAVCNLASIALPYFIEGGRFNFDRLRQITAVVVRNLNRVIDINFYPTPETRRSNMRHRPIGIGVQGLADVFALLGLAWEEPAAATLNQEIFENIYYAALQESHVLATRDGPYETFTGSPTAAGLLQPDLWSAEPGADGKRIGPICLSAAYLDWDGLRQKIMNGGGLRNSLLLAPMPTASTSQILGFNECVEPFTSNIYVRRTLAGEFTVVNKYLVADLMAAGLWTPELKDRIIAANGSVQGIAEIPGPLKARYKTVWEIKQKTLIDMAADRGAYICQSQSLNLFVQDPTIAKLSSMHFYGWRRGLKTGIYYLRTKSAVQAIKFTVDPTVVAAAKAPEECLLCSS
jgi:ribonucleotide reductase alpha subunit